MTTVTGPQSSIDATTALGRIWIHAGTMGLPCRREPDRARVSSEVLPGGGENGPSHSERCRGDMRLPGLSGLRTRFSHWLPKRAWRIQVKKVYVVASRQLVQIRSSLESRQFGKAVRS